MLFQHSKGVYLLDLLMEVFDKDFIRIGAFNKYTSIIYDKTLSSDSTYTLVVPFEEQNVYLLNNGKYLLIDEEYLAEMLYIQKEESSTSELTSKGYNIKKIMKERSFTPTQNFSGKVPEIMRQMITNNLISPTDERRKIDMVRLSSTYPDMTETIKLQRTGSNLFDEQVEISKQYDIGFKIVPIFSEFSETGKNIQYLEYQVIKGVDRTESNTEGNDPVIFSVELNNLLSSSYVKSEMDYRNVAIVAGEGEGADRKVIETGDMEVYGFNRKELYVDARDLQSMDEEGEPITEEEYTELLNTRGNNSLQDYKSYESYSGVISTGGRSYQYGVDFFIGDKVTLHDVNLDFTMDAVITKVTFTQSRQGFQTEVTFGYDFI